MNVEIALEINKLIHDECKDVPHDIGLRIEKLLSEYLKWTDTDLQEFAEWCSEWSCYLVQYDYGSFEYRWYHFNLENMDDCKTTSQLREQWEIETGRREK